MLFYDHKNRICIKLGERRCKTLNSTDIFQIDKWTYSFDDGYFIPTDIIDGELYKYCDRKIHKNDMEILSIYDVGFDEDFLNFIMNIKE